jgi:hypothetical protein
VREHVDICAKCQATMIANETLFAAIDSNLHERANSKCRGSFASRVETALNKQPERRRAIAPAWALASAAAILACIILGTQEFREHSRHSQVAGAAGPKLAQHNSRLSKPEIAHEGISMSKALPKHRPRNMQLDFHVVREPEVLVPPDEREAFAKFVAGSRQTQGLAQALLRPAPAKEESFPLELIQIAQLEIKPLESQDDAQGIVEK